MRIVKAIVVALAVIAVAVPAFIHLAPEQALHVALTADRSRSGLERKQIDLADGQHWVYLEGGRGEPLLLLHGFGADKDNFTRVARFLTPHYRVIVPDLIGFGESAHPANADYAPSAQAERVRALAQALGITTVHIGGSSMGGQIAMTYAASHPTEVKSLWLLDPAGVWSAPASELQRVMRESGRNPLMARSEDEFAAVVSFVMTDPPFMPRPMLTVMAQKRMRNFDLETRIFRQVTSDSIETRIAGLNTKALIVWGEKDRAINVATADILHKLLPNSQVIILRGVGHLPMLELPRKSAEDYFAFRQSF